MRCKVKISPKSRNTVLVGMWAVIAVRLLPGATGTATQSVSATFAPVAKLSVPATVTLTNSSRFAPFQGTRRENSRARTSGAGGGSITLQVTGDFTPPGGPTAAGGAISYVCSGASLGTACSGSQTASTTVQTPVLTLP